VGTEGAFLGDTVSIVGSVVPSSKFISTLMLSMRSYLEMESL
jgi:hypothetical protein